VKIIGKNRAELTRDVKKFILKVQEPANVTLKTWSTNPPNHYDAPNPGTVLVGFEVTMPPKAKGVLTVLLIPESAQKQVKKNIQSLRKWPANRKTNSIGAVSDFSKGETRKQTPRDDR
jgi:hypothetical protein